MGFHRERNTHMLCETEKFTNISLRRPQQDFIMTPKIRLHRHPHCPNSCKISVKLLQFSLAETAQYTRQCSWCRMHYDTYSLPLKPLYSISSSSKTQYSTPQTIFLTQHEWSSIPSTSWLFLPNLVAAQLWNSPGLPFRNYSWFLPNSKFLEQYWGWESVKS
jgi:hypothetical protein